MCLLFAHCCQAELEYATFVSHGYALAKSTAEQLRFVKYLLAEPPAGRAPKAKARPKALKDG